MRSFLFTALVTSVLSSSGCFDDSEEDGFGPYPQPAFTFHEPSVTMGVGLHYRVPSDHLGAIDQFTFTSSDSSVTTSIEGNDLVLVADHDGLSIIEVRSLGSDDVIDTLAVGANTIDHVELHYRSSAIAPAISSLAAVPGADSVDLAYISSRGLALAGTGEVTTTGDAISLGGFQELRLSDLYTHREHVSLTFRALGHGELVAHLGARTQTFPIDVIEAPSTIELIPIVLRGDQLVAAPSAVAVDEPVGIDVVPRAEDGRFVAGVVANWTLDVAPWTDTRGVTEVVFSKDAPGPATVQAEVAGVPLTLIVTAN